MHFVKSLKKTTEGFLGCTLEQVMLSLPSSFDAELQLDIKKCVEKCGIKVADILLDSVSALSFYSSDISGYKSVAVVEVGGFHSRVTKFHVRDGLFIADKYQKGSLTGKKIDSLLFNFAKTEAERKLRLGNVENKRALRKLSVQCLVVKHSLSSCTTSTLSIEAFHEGVDFFSSVPRTRFENIAQYAISSFVNETVEFCGEVDAVILVGGSCRIPMVINSFKSKFSKVFCEIDPNEVVAKGAMIELSVRESNKVEHSEQTLALTKPISVVSGKSTLLTVDSLTLCPFSKTIQVSDSNELYVMENDLQLALIEMDDKTIPVVVELLTDNEGTLEIIATNAKQVLKAFIKH